LTVTRQLIVFFSIAFGFSWLVEAWMLAAHARIEFIILASCGPTVAAIVTNRLANGSYRAFRFNVSWLRTLAATVLGVCLIVAAYVILPSIAVVDASKLHWRALLSIHVYNYSTLLGGPLFEEPGWRGFALPRLESRLSPLSSALLLGGLWAAWHLPLFFYPGWTTFSIWMYFLLESGFSVLMTLGTNLARFAVITPILMHAMLNTITQFFPGLFANAQPGSGGFLLRFLAKIPGHAHFHLSVPFDLLITLGGWTVALLVIAMTKGSLGYRAEAGSESSSQTQSAQA
jgi:membrane protease YdiL (CAAX protease family)